MLLDQPPPDDLRYRRQRDRSERRPGGQPRPALEPGRDVEEQPAAFVLTAVGSAASVSSARLANSASPDSRCQRPERQRVEDVDEHVLDVVGRSARDRARRSSGRREPLDEPEVARPSVGQATPHRVVLRASRRGPTRPGTGSTRDRRRRGRARGPQPVEVGPERSAPSAANSGSPSATISHATRSPASACERWRGCRRPRPSRRTAPAASGAAVPEDRVRDQARPAAWLGQACAAPPSLARAASKRRQTIAWKHESQYHWWVLLPRGEGEAVGVPIADPLTPSGPQDPLRRRSEPAASIPSGQATCWPGRRFRYARTGSPSSVDGSRRRRRRASRSRGRWSSPPPRSRVPPPLATSCSRASTSAVSSSSPVRLAEGPRARSRSACRASLPLVATAAPPGGDRGHGRAPESEESDAYFATRPHASRLGALASPQSSVIATRGELEERFAELAERYPEGSDPAGPTGGAAMAAQPSAVEFWEGRPNRLHNRLASPARVDGDWKLERLAP